MSNRKILAGTAAAFAFAALILSSFAPAWAAEKVFEVSEQNVTDTVPFSTTLCGITDTFTFVIHIGQAHTVVYDNGHVVFSSTENIKVWDSSSKLVFVSPRGEHQGAGEGGLPTTFQANFVGKCVGQQGV